MKEMEAALICKALGDSSRFRIVKMLSDGEKCGCKLLESFDITQPALNLLNGSVFWIPKSGPRDSSMANIQNQNELRILRTSGKAVAYIIRHTPFQKGEVIMRHPEHYPNTSDFGPEPFVVNIACSTEKNLFYRRTLWTGIDVYPPLRRDRIGGTS